MTHLPQRIEVTGRQVRPGDLVHLNGIGWRQVRDVAFAGDGELAIDVGDTIQSLRSDSTLLVLRDQSHSDTTLES